MILDILVNSASKFSFDFGGVLSFTLSASNPVSVYWWGY